MEEQKIAIRLSGVKKRYKLGQIGGGTLTADLQSWWARVRGKEDPNTLIGTDQRLVGQTFMALNGIELDVNVPVLEHLIVEILLGELGVKAQERAVFLRSVGE